jgi:hypothetical protein
MAMVYVGIAAGQFAQTLNNLEWLLTEPSPKGRAGFPEAFNRIFSQNHVSNIGDLYVRPDGTRDSAAYQKHSMAVETAAAQNPESPRTRALVAMVEWGRGRRANAIFEAKKIKDPLNRLTGLAAMLEEADRLEQLSPSADPNSSPDRGATSPLASQPAQ